MKRIITWILIIALIVFVIDWGILGLKILNHDYDILSEAYVGLGCSVILPVCVIFKLFTERCPHCGKIQMTKGKYCPYCEKEI